MEKLHFAGKYSFKDIPTPSKLEYMKHLVHSIEKVLRRMRWRTFYFLQLGECENSSDKEEDDEHIENSKFSSIFKSGAKPPSIGDMVNFEKDVLDLQKS